ncbi:transposase [Staphylococcus phage vB_SepM_ phiIPLA-C1C]|uniref:Transposase n=1 Tax=Staphylococcus phage vB_SepM_ phiIPLA-C1C TaxID=1572704 RepID=A0A0D3MWF3_9CAUD|nr:transposase [Staphylococcus phage phiIPLA-C1C]AJA42222.1 transposase [Staphylococcus phage phiIPLA-C1C]
MIRYKTEIKPNKKQIKEINKTINACKFVYNKFIEINKIRYDNGLKFLNHMKFSVWYNNEFIPNNKDKNWTKEVSTKATKQAMANAENSYVRFWNKTSGYPNFKKKQSNGSYYLIGKIKVERHRIKLPNLKWVKLKEKGYIPNKNIKSATVIKENDRYFISVLVDEEPKIIFKKPQTEGIGIDLGLKDTLFTPSGVKITDLRKNKKLIKLNKSLKRQQRKLSRKQKKSNNWFKQLIKVQRLYRKISNLKKDIKRKSILSIVKENPQYITIENLNIKGMMKNRKLSNAFQQVGLGYIVDWLKWKCYEYGIELRQVDRFYPSSQLCNQCGNRQKMPLNKRVYKCENCGTIEDRDINASINLKQAKEYTVLV